MGWQRERGAVRIDVESVWDAIPKVPLRFLGWGLVSVWSNVMYLYPSVALPGLPDDARVGFDLVLVLTMVLMAVAARFRRGFAPLAARRWATPAALLLLLISTQIDFLAVWFHIPSSALMWLSLLLGGVGTACMMLLTSEFFGFIHPKRAILYMASGWLAGAVLTVFLRALPLPHLWACMTALPIVVALCSWRSCKSLSASERSFMASRRFSFPWLPLVPIALCAIVKRCLSALVFLEVSTETVNDLGMMAAAVVVLAGLMRYGGDLNMRSLWKLGVGLMSPSLAPFAMAVFGGQAIAGFIAASLSSAAYYLLFLLMTAIFANISYRWGVCALWLFSIEHASHLAVGTGATAGMEQLITVAKVPLAFLDVAFVPVALASMVVVSQLFRRFSPDSLWGLAIDDDTSFSESERLRRLCEELIHEHGLTRREGEILFMSMQGKRPATIAEELFIEVSTTRTHIKHIYTKLGIHSRKELLDMVGGAPAGVDS